MVVTIATHNGSAVSREHNIRNRRVTNPQEHIDRNGKYEIWHDEKVREAYDRIFGQALEKYNSCQKREDRKIKSYYNHIEKDSKKHSVYEIIIGIYGKDENGRPICPEEIGYEIMREFVENWNERNPNLEMIGAYYHADEPKSEPHVHIDYIPVAHGYTRGLETQNGLVKALEEMGLQKSGKATAQIKWESRENKYLEDLCISKGLEVSHPQRGKCTEHLHTETFKAKTEHDTEIQKREKAEAEREQAEQERQKALREYHRAKTKCDTEIQKKEKAEAEREQAEQERQKALRECDKVKAERETEIREKEKAQAEKEQAEQERLKALRECHKAKTQRDAEIQKREKAEAEREQAEQERLEVLRKCDDAKAETDFYNAVRQAANEIKDGFEPERMIIKKTEAKKKLFGKDEPETVTIKTEDFDRLVLAASQSVELIEKMDEIEKEMKKDAQEKNINSIDLYELMKEEKIRDIIRREQDWIREAEREMQRMQERLHTAEKEQKRLKEAERTVQRYEDVLSHFTEQWEKMQKSTERIIYLEKEYFRTKSNETMYWVLGDGFNTDIFIENPNKPGVSEKEFLQIYRAECRRQGIEPNTKMTDRLEELEREERYRDRRRGIDWER